MTSPSLLGVTPRSELTMAFSIAFKLYESMYHEPTKRITTTKRKEAESIPRFVIRLEQKRSTIGGTDLGNAFQTNWTSVVLHLNLVKHSYIGSPGPYGIETSPKRFNRLLHLCFLNSHKENIIILLRLINSQKKKKNTYNILLNSRFLSLYLFNSCRPYHHSAIEFFRQI